MPLLKSNHMIWMPAEEIDFEPREGSLAVDGGEDLLEELTLARERGREFSIPIDLAV